MLKYKKLLSKGDGLLLSQNSGYETKIDGAIIVTAIGQEYTNSQEHFLLSSFENLILFLLNHTVETAEELKSLLKIYKEKNLFSIVNIQENKREIVGSISAGTVSILKSLIFPQNSIDVPRSDKKILHLTASGGASNPGTPPLTAAPLLYYGAYTAWNLINEGKLGILTHFQIKHFIFDCGVITYDEDFATSCFVKDIDKFGLAHLSAPSSLMTIAEINLFKSLNLTLPVVGFTPDDYSLNSTAVYPLFTRVIISNRYLYSLISLLFRALGWRKFCVLYSDDATGRSGYSAIMNNAGHYKLEILNSESSRVICPDLNRTNIKQYSNLLKAIIDTEARLLVLLLMPPAAYYVLEELYDMGLRKGDLFVFVTNQEMLTMIQYDFLYENKFKETGVPMMAIHIGAWAIASQYSTVPFPSTCYSYDAAYLIGLALDYMINQGDDYNDPHQTNLAIRAQKFTGCTGIVSIDKSSNDRVMDSFDVMVSKIDTISGNVISYKMGEFHPFSGTMLIINTPIIYGDGTTVKPDDLRNQNNICPFPEKQVSTFTKGRILVFAICFGFALVSFIATAYIWKNWWNITIEVLKERQEISLQDIIVELTVAIEFFQFAAMGPDIAPINSFLAKISSSLSLSLENIFALQKGVFWIIMDGVYAAIVLWLILCLVILLSLDEKFPKVSIFRLLAWLADYLMPILGNLCFIPFISMCLNVFICDQSIGENFTDSFLADDCYYFCWKDEHLIYANFSFIALLCYEPLAVLCRPLWQELQQMVHIHTAPPFLMVKTVIQVILIVMNKTVKRTESTVHGALFAVLMIAYIGYIFRYKPYNYPRLCWWQGLSLFGVVWLSVISTISSNVGGNVYIYFTVVCIGWIIIALVGVYVQRKMYPSLLYKKKGLDTTHLFKFAFTFGKHSKNALAKIVPDRRSSTDLMFKDFSIAKEIY